MMSRFALDEFVVLKRFEDVFKTGVENAQQRHATFEKLDSMKSALIAVKGVTSEEGFRAAKKRAQELGELGKRELETEFPYLHSLLLVRMCSILEAAVDQAVVAALGMPSIWSDVEMMGQIKIPLAVYGGWNERERCEHLMEELAVRSKASYQIGVGRFETLLGPVGLGGGVSDSVRRVFVEMMEARNVIVHRHGKVDKQFKERVAWAKEKVGDDLIVNNKRFKQYRTAGWWYAVEVLDRMILRGLEPADDAVKPGLAKFRDELAAELEAHLKA
jgi:hypothetical protein